MTDTAPDDATTAAAWLEYLYGPVEGGWLTLFAIDRTDPTEKHTRWFRVDGELAQAATVATELSARCCVWFGVATRTERLVGKRGGAEHCATVPALWLDLDVAGDVHAQGNLPPDRDAARAILDRYPHPPTAVVDSGHGLQAWWVLDEPADASEVADVLPRWNATWARLAEPHHVDNVFDLPRIMRLPGTVNRKADPRPVTVTEADWDRTYGLADLAEGLDDPPAPPEVRTSTWTGDEGLPGQVFNARHTGDEILLQLGFAHSHDTGSDRHYTRPGKERRQGSSATVYGEDGHTTIWSDTVVARWPALEVRRPYDPFGLYAATTHAGDHSAAAAELERRGYDTLPSADTDALDALLADAGKVDEPPHATEPDGGWQFIDLAAILTGNWSPPVPTLFPRSDGVGLVYPGRVHSIAGEPGSGKTWLALHAIAHTVTADPGARALMIDHEDTPGSFVSRLLSLGVPTDVIATRVTYVRPDGPLIDRQGRVAASTMARLLELAPTIAVVDSVGESVAAEGLNPSKDEEVARWFSTLPRVLARAGAAVLLVDHVAKDRDTRGNWAIGSQRKLAAIDGAAYVAHVKVAPTRERDGHLTLVCAKDRHGTHQRSHTVASVDITNVSGGVRVTVHAPAGTWRPTALMERVSRFLEQTPTASTRGVEREVQGKGEHLRKALDVLADEGYVGRQIGPGGSTQWVSVRPYRESEEGLNGLSGGAR